MRGGSAVIYHDVEQNSDEWLELRKGKVTSSNYAAIMANADLAFGEPAKRYALQIALEQLTGDKAEAGFSNEHTERGHEQEPIARALYESERFITIGNGGFFDCGTYGCSPDGLVMGDGLIEIKSVIASVHYSTIRRGSFDPSYKWQLIGNLEGTGRDWIDFVSYCAEFPSESRLVVYRLTRDECKLQMAALSARRGNFLELIESFKADILAIGSTVPA